MDDLSVTEIKGCLPNYGKDYAIATRCVAKENGDMILLSFIYKNVFNFCLYMKGREPDNYLIYDILSESKNQYFPYFHI